MIKLSSSTIALSVILLSACATAPTPAQNPWNQPTTPTPAPARSIGFYSAGCLQGSVSISPDGIGYQVMRTSRRRYWGHPKLIAFLERLGKSAHQAGLGRLAIGDMGLVRGGPTLSGHASHQIGLDVDIWFWQQPESEPPLSLGVRETLEASTMLKSFDDVDFSKFTTAQVQALKLASQDPETERIFVNPAIKRALCTQAAQDVEVSHSTWLAKLRPWWGHDDHFHVRLKCDVDSPDCRHQEEVPPGIGCDATIDEWFTKEARKKAQDLADDHAPNPMPKLPDACQAVLDEKGVQ